MISKATIDKVYEAVRVEEVIQDYVQLKKSGANFKGLSPFTTERTPSFMVSPVKQIWKDFSSGKGGNAIAFLMEMEQYTYPEAIRHLAQKYNIEIEETAQSSEQKEAKDHQESLYLITEFAQGFFQRQLHENAQGRAIGLSYFHERGFSEETIKRFGLGFGGTDWQGLAKAALEQGYKPELLEETGVCFKVDHSSAVPNAASQSEWRDRFRDRVIFPIQSTSGRILGFGGRILDTQKKVAKYVNSPESPIYHKAKALYGIHYAKSAIAKFNNCYLVEGYTDVIQLHQRGVENVVSSSGTALTESQIRMIRRLCSTITLIFDADQAGVRASMRSIDLILAEGLNVRVLSLPEGEDPDSFARNHDFDEITAYFEAHQIDFITYKSQILLGEAKDAITKSEAIREIVKSIWHIGDPIKRELYIKQCVDTFNLSEATVYGALADVESKEKRDARSRSQTQGAEVLTVVSQTKPVESRDRQKELERSLIESLLLYGPMREVFDDEFLEPDEKSGELIARRSSVESKVYEKIYLDLQQDEMRFSDPVYSSLFDWVIRFYTEQQGEEITDLLKFLEKQQKEELIEHVSSIVFEYEQYALHQWERKNIYPKERKDQIALHVSETILSLRSHWVQQHLSELQKRTAEETDSHLLEEVMDYLMLNQVLSKRLNRVLTV